MPTNAEYVQLAKLAYGTTGTPTGWEREFEGTVKGVDEMKRMHTERMSSLNSWRGWDGDIAFSNCRRSLAA